MRDESEGPKYGLSMDRRSPPRGVPVLDEPRVRRTLLIALRDTARTELTREHNAEIGALVSGVARDIWLGNVALGAEWYADAISVALVEAIHATLPPPRFTPFVGKFCDAGFGRIRKLFLGIATPYMLAERAPEFWRYDHATGLMTTTRTPTGAIVELVDHPYCASPPCRALLTEYVRHAVSLTRARSVSSTANTSPLSLRMDVRWSI